jgi:hypothetical protein
VPGPSLHRGGRYRYDVQVLKGTRLPFREEKCESEIPMEDRDLYLLHEGQHRPLRLLPFFRLIRAPRTQVTACYFYSKLESNSDVRFVSYHFDREPEIVVPDLDVIQTVKSVPA